MASTRLTKTFSGSGTSNKIMTFSFWCKKTIQSGWSYIIHNGQSDGDPVCVIGFEDNFLKFNYYVGGSTLGRLKTNRLFRDVSSWYHVVVAIDTTQATSSNRIKFYVNGVQETSFSQSDYPSQNQTITLLQGTDVHTIGASAVPDGYFDGLLAHFHAVDGTAYDADTFGETESTSGIWKPKTAPSVTYGTNGFFLKFQDSSSLGDDSSGNDNDFTLNGSGRQVLDTPSNVFATYNANVTQTAGTSGRNASVSLSLANGNLSAGAGAAIFADQVSTLGFTKGKYYAEFQTTGDTYTAMGIVNQKFIDAYLGDYIGSEATSGVNNIGYQSVTGVVKKNDSIQYTGSTFTSANDIIGVAVDLDNNYIYFHKNGTYQNSGDPTSGATGTGGVSITADEYFFAVSSHNNAASGTEYVHANFGNGYFGTTAVSSAENDDAGYGKFEYDVPAGYYALCTKNINTYG